MKCFMGIDIGTSSVKAVIIDEAGNLLGSGHQACDLTVPCPGWVEQSPSTWWSACCAAVRQAVHACGCGDSVAGIGLSGQMQGCLLMDRFMQPIGNCMIWLDQRSSQEVLEIEAMIPDCQASQITANHCLNSFWAPKLLWLKKNDPAAYSRAFKVLFPKDYIRYQMTGEVSAEVSDASPIFSDGCTAQALVPNHVGNVGIDSDLVPQHLAESTEVVGSLRREVASAWNLPADIPVVAGGGDQPAGGVGTGVVHAGILGSTIGTSGVIFGCSDRPLIDTKKRAIMTMAHSVQNKWCFLGLELSAGGAFKWLRDTFFSSSQEATSREGLYDKMTALAKSSHPGCEGLLFLPYLNGEKTPILDENARGVFFGLSYRHTLHDICRSVMEGVTFGLRETIEICREMGQEVTEVRANGGGAKSELWLQLQADIYRANIVTMSLEEGPAAGAAMMAAVGTGAFQSVEEVCSAWLKVTKTVEPDPHNAAVYDEYFANYRMLYQDLQNAFARQAGLVKRHMLSYWEKS